MKNIFLDCGTHLCEGLYDFYNNGIIDDTFEIHTFEANPACYASERIKNFPLAVTLHEKAVWTQDGYILFNQENHKVSGSGSPTDGVSDIDGWGSSVDGIGFDHPGYLNRISVESIDFSKFVNDLPNNSNIICKMDIEGSEFIVLRKLILDESIKKINKIYVEFHHHLMPNESLNSRDEIINSMRDLGVTVETWL
jgi:FkbM family methyltransferase